MILLIAMIVAIIMKYISNTNNTGYAFSICTCKVPLSIK